MQNNLSNPASVAPYKRLAKLLIRAFYNGPCPPKSYRDADDVEGTRNKIAKVDTTGLGIILMEYLLTKEWVGEVEIVEQVRVNHKLIRRALKYLEREQLLMSEHRRETKRGQKRDVVKAVMNAHAEAEREDEQEGDEDIVEKLVRPHTISYYAVDFPRLFDAVQLRLHLMKKTLSDELNSKEVVAKYQCSSSWCAKEYSSYEVNWLIKGEELRCDICDTVVLQVLASGQTGDDIARRDRRNMIASRLTRMETQLKDILQLVASLRSNPSPPFYGSLRDWAITQQALHQQQQQQQDGGRGQGASGRGQGLPGMLVSSGQPNNYWQDTQVEVNLDSELQPVVPGPSGYVRARPGSGPVTIGTTEERKSTVLPPWMVRFSSSSCGGSDAASNAPGSSDAKGGSQAEQAEAARRAAYIQQYQAMLAQAQAEKQEQMQQGQLGAGTGSSRDYEEPLGKRPRLDNGQPPHTSGVGTVDELLEWAEVNVTENIVVKAELPAPSPAPAVADDGLDWEDI